MYFSWWFKVKAGSLAEWGFWLTDLHASPLPSLLCKYHVVVERWMTPLSQHAVARSWRCRCVLINQHGWKQGCKRLFRWWKSCLPLSLLSALAECSFFICTDIKVKCAALYVLAKIHTHLFQKLFIFPFACTHTCAPTHTYCREVAPPFFITALYFWKGLAQISYRED